MPDASGGQRRVLPRLGLSMARFEPFFGTTYDPGRVRAEDVIAPLRRRQPGRAGEPGGEESLQRHPCRAAGVRARHGPYAHAAQLFAGLARAEVVRVGAEPGFFVYRMTFPTEDGTVRSTTGVLGALAIDPTEVLPHEQTTPKEKHDRLSLSAGRSDELLANLGALDGRGSREGARGRCRGRRTVRGAGRRRRPARVMAVHRCRRRSSRIVAWSRSTPVLIADGHHR